jgi:hypothetical protein
VPACEGGNVSYVGEVVRHPTGAPAPGVSLQFERMDGDGPHGFVAEARTDASGAYTLSVPADGSGSLMGRFRIRDEAEGRELLTDEVELPAILYRGDSRLLPRLSMDPFLDIGWDVRRRGTWQAIAGGTAEFVRTGGVAVHPDTVLQTIAANGGVLLRLTAVELGSVEGEMRIVSPEGEVFTRRVVERTTFWVSADPYAGPLYVGPWLGFSARLVDGEGDPVANAALTLRRTGGVATREPQHHVQTSPDGHFSFADFIVLEVGALELEIVVTSDGEAPRIVSGVVVEAAERDDFYEAGDIVVDG